MSVLSGSKISNRSRNSAARIISPNGDVFVGGSNKSNHSAVSKRDDRLSARRSITGSVASGKSETYSRKAPGSILSGVSSQVARKKRSNYASEVSGPQNRSHSTSALSRDRKMTNGSIKSSQSMLSLAVTQEIRDLEVDEKKCLLDTIAKYNTAKRQEEQWRIKLKTLIHEIQSKRPPKVNAYNDKCYICSSKFWPLIVPKICCNACQIDVCKSCLDQTSSNDICKYCASEMQYKKRLTLVFQQRKTDDDADDGEEFGIIELERMLERYKNDPPAPKDEVDILNEIIAAEDSVISSKKNQSDSGSKSLKLPKITAKSKSSSASTSSSRKGSRVEEMHGTSPNSLIHSSDVASEMKMETETVKSITGTEVTKISDIKSSHSKSSIAEKEVSEYGEILVGLSYNFNSEELKVVVKRGRDLKKILKKEETSNPYVKVLLLPDPTSENKRKSKIHHKNLNPEFDDLTVYKGITFDELLSRTLRVAVWHSEFLGRDIFMGQVLIPLHGHNFEVMTPNWYKLENPRTISAHPEATKYYGDIVIGIKFCPKNENMPVDNVKSSNGLCTLFLWVNQATNLLTSGHDSLPSAYAKCVLSSDDGQRPTSRKFMTLDRRKSEIPKSNADPQSTDKAFKKKSQVIRKNFNPIWNFESSFQNILYNDLKKKEVEISVWDKTATFLPDNFLGRVVLNKHGGSLDAPENSMWEKMLDAHKTWITAKLLLHADRK